MSQESLCLKLDSVQNQEEIFLKDPSSDFFLISEGKVLPLHKNLLQKSRYLMDKVSLGTKVHILENPIKNQILENVLSLFYGKTIEIEANRKLFEYLEVIRFLEIQEDLERSIFNELQSKFSDCSIFFLMEAANKFNQKDLEENCRSELIQEEFEQFKYNKFELLQCSEPIFKMMMNLHQEEKENLQIQGFPQNQIQSIVNEYCAYHSMNERVKEIFDEIVGRKSKQFQNELDSSGESPRKRKNSFSSPLKFSKNRSSSTENESSPLSKIKEKLLSIKEANEKLNVENENMQEEINEIKSNISDPNSFVEDEEFDAFYVKLSEVRRESENQSVKLKQLQQNFKQYSEHHERQNSLSPTASFSEQMLSPKGSSNSGEIRPRRKSAEVFTQNMPILEHTKDLSYQ